MHVAAGTHMACCGPQHLRSTILKSMLDTPSLRTGVQATDRLVAHPTRSSGMAQHTPWLRHGACGLLHVDRCVARCTLHAACCTWIVALHVARCMRPVARCAFAQPLRRTDAPQVFGALLEQLADPRLQRRRDRNHNLPHSIPCARMLLRIGTMSYVAKCR